jgi:DNA replication protein DnaC
VSWERRRDMAEISEVVKSALGEPATKDLAERIERELAARGFYGETEAERGEPERCGGCGGLKQERDHERNSDKVCRCGGRKRRLLSYLDAADPERRMTLDALDASEPTVTAALEAACGIVSGERGRGMLLMGLPGRGKTHLMVGLGRALLAGDRDAGYYNVVRLVSRIQDTYSDFGGETRRAIVESVASHEVVLLDDLGKEHASTNVESIVYELFDALHVARVTLVAATNVPATRGEGYRGPTLSERYDEAVRSRLRAMCERFVVRGEDRRQAAWEW